MGNANKIAARMRHWCAEADVGYCWDHRFDIREGGETDCSALYLYCLWEAGYLSEKPTWGNTDTLRQQVEPLGFVFLASNKNKQPPAGVGRLRPGHVAVSLGDGTIAQASINELGTVRGGKPGDQTGRETNISRDPNNWTWDIWPPDLCGTTQSSSNLQNMQNGKGGIKVRNYGTVQRGSSGRKVKILQCVLNESANARLAEDSSFGPATDAAVRSWQHSNGLEVDGIVGPKTWGSL